MKFEILLEHWHEILFSWQVNIYNNFPSYPHIPGVYLHILCFAVIGAWGREGVERLLTESRLDQW